MIQSGYDKRVASSGHTIGVRATRRNTAFTNDRVDFGARSTEADTAAWSGTPANTS